MTCTTCPSRGPLAVDFLQRHVPDIRELPYFHHVQTRLFDAPVMLSRTGYTGERGYEIFCRAQDAPMLWDTILSEGADMGIIPCRFTVLDMLRVESYLLFYPYDNSQMYPFEDEPPGDTLWELGLQFTVTPGKTGFRGAEEHARLKDRERFRIFGVLVDGDTATAEGDELWADGRKVGVITCGMYSTLTEAVHGHRPDGRGPGRAGQPAGSARCQRQRTRHRARAAVRRPAEDEAERGGLIVRQARRPATRVGA